MKPMHTTAAIELVQEETARVRAELDAFDEFIEAARDISPNADPRSASQPAVRADGYGTGTCQGRKILSAYQDTVMAVPHYENDYGDTIKERALA